MTPFILRLAAGAALALALAGAASAADSVLKVKATTNAADTGRCLTATVLFAKVSQKEGEEVDPQMAQLAQNWIDYLKTKDEAFQAAALDGMKATTDAYEAAIKEDSAAGLGKVPLQSAGVFSKQRGRIVPSTSGLMPMSATIVSPHSARPG